MIATDAGRGQCAFCRLPLPDAGPESGLPVNEERYCCFGCRFAAGVLDARGEGGQVTWALARLGLSIFFTMNVMVFTMALWSRDFYGQAATPGMADPYHAILRYLGLLFSLPVLVALGGPIAEEAWNGLRRGAITTDLLIVAGVAAAFGASVIAVFRGGEHVYFEVACVVLVFVSLGRWFEAASRVKATAAIDALERLLPDRAQRIAAGGVCEVRLDELAPGDVVRVGAGERIPADGIVRGDGVSVDEQLFSGECWPVFRGPGERVLGGTVALDGQVDVEVTAAVTQGAFARLVAAVRQARASRSRSESFANVATAWFVPLVSVVAVATFALHAYWRGFEPALMAALAVVLIACPCALGLATPLAIWCALGRATREGVLFRRSDAIERLEGVRAIRFDKTGTLTTGAPAVHSLDCEPGEQFLRVEQLSVAIARESTHTFSKAIARHGERQGRPVALSRVEQLPGLGLTAVTPGGATRVLLGSRRLFELSCWVIPPALDAKAAIACARGMPVTFSGWDGRARGLYTFRETLRAEAAQATQWFLQQQFDLAILTGDHAACGDRIARELKVPVESGLLPEAKAAAIARLAQEGQSVAFVGDGINDAPALAGSRVGIAMGCGTDVTRETADICLLGNNLGVLPWVFELARATCRTVRWNLLWAFGYNSIGVLAAAWGLLSPALAALLMTLSSLFVIANSLRLQKFPSPALIARPPAVQNPPAATEAGATDPPGSSAAHVAPQAGAA